MISTVKDEFIIEKDEPIWVAELSDGRRVFQDDYRPGLEEHSAWIRLATYLKENPELYVVNLRLQFRSNIRWVSEHKPGYYFCKGSIGILTYERSERLNSYHMGFLTLAKHAVVITEYKLPELETLRNKIVDVDEIRKNRPQCLLEFDNAGRTEI